MKSEGFGPRAGQLDPVWDPKAPELASSWEDGSVSSLTHSTGCAESMRSAMETHAVNCEHRYREWTRKEMGLTFDD